MKKAIRNKKRYAPDSRWARLVFILLFSAMFLAGSSGAGFSQPSGVFDDPPIDRPRFKKEGRGYPPLSCEEREAIRKRVNMIRMWRLTEELDLSEKKADKLFPLIRRLDKEKLELEKERNELMKNLRENLTKGKLKDSELKKMIRNLEENHAAVQNLKKERFKEMKNVLSLEEQAKFVLFMESFPKEIRSIIRNAKRKGREGRGRKFGGE